MLVLISPGSSSPEAPMLGHGPISAPGCFVLSGHLCLVPSRSRHEVFDTWRSNGGGLLAPGAKPGCGAGGLGESEDGMGRLEEVVAGEGKFAGICQGLSGIASACVGLVHAVHAVSPAGLCMKGRLWVLCPQGKVLAVLGGDQWQASRLWVLVWACQWSGESQGAQC